MDLTSCVLTAPADLLSSIRGVGAARMSDACIDDLASRSTLISGEFLARAASVGHYCGQGWQNWFSGAVSVRGMTLQVPVVAQVVMG